jgi:ribosomal protein S18 acetylase RimI-like enzyme
MDLVIDQNQLTEEIKKKILDGFSRDAIEKFGYDGQVPEPISFEIFDESEFVGAVVVYIFWGQLYIKYLFVEEKYRCQGVGRQLVERALQFGKKQGCQIAMVDTMNYQAPEFYEKLGFVLEFTRTGLAEGLSIHYYKKKLEE